MNLFIGCSSSFEVEDQYKESTLELVKEIAKIPDVHLILGTSHLEDGLMGICYQEFKKNQKQITGITLNQYQDLKPLKMERVISVETTMDRTKEIYQKSDLLLFLPGGLGTYSELLSCMSEVVEKKENKTIIIYNKDFFYTPVIKELYFLYKKRFINKNINEYCKIESESVEILEFIKKEGEV